MADIWETNDPFTSRTTRNELKWRYATPPAAMADQHGLAWYNRTNTFLAAAATERTINASELASTDGNGGAARRGRRGDDSVATDRPPLPSLYARQYIRPLGR